ncbi:MAG: tryptophan-rich sensory protein [Clostridium sp.]|nr:tryptophan-rich sensory protein [Clostridium sp.]
MKNKKTGILTSIFLLALPTLVGLLSSRISGMGQGQMTPYPIKPPLTPPGAVFPIVWTILYALMGIALYLVVNAQIDKQDKKIAVVIFMMQLFFNFIWTIAFFRLQMCWLSFIIICVLLFLIFLTVLVFGRINRLSAYILIPYLLWVTFALYLNLGYCILN